MPQVVASVEDAAYDSAVAGLSPDLGRERSVAELLGWAREVLEPEARRWIGRLEPESRDIAGYQLGWWDSQGRAGAARQRDPAHQLDDVLVETGEKTEPVLAGQVLTAVGGRARNADAPGPAAERLRLHDGHREFPLSQLMRGRQAGHAAAQHRDRLARHAVTSPRADR